MDGFATHRFRVQRRSPDPLVLSRGHGESSLPGAGRERERAGSTTSRPACDRCRRLKKRCSRAVPDCAACVHAGRKCSYQVLQARVQELTQYVAEMQQDREQETEQEHEHERTPDQTWENRALETQTSRWNGVGDVANGPATIPAPLDIPDSSLLVDAFFHHVYRAYPFIDEERVRRALAVRAPDYWDTDSMILYIIMAIGYTSLQRSGKAPPSITTGFDIPYADIMQRCIMDESIDSIQILVLLALYSLFDPHGPSTWSIVGIITRQAMAQGLTRPTTGEDLPPKTVELRRRLFWSIFGLDRMIAVSVGAPPGLTSDEMDVPFPAIMVEEFASEKRAEHASMLQVSRHVIELRQLESKIMATVHHQRPMAVSALTQTDRSTIKTRLRSEIENWYSHGCLISRPELDNVRLHDTMGWLNARYYHLLLILYYPCQFNSGSTKNGTARVMALLGLVRKFSQYNRVLLNHQQLPLNRVTLSRLFPPCLILVYCLARGGASNAINLRNEIRAFIDILDSFPSYWTHARRLSGILLDLNDLLTSHEAYPAETTREDLLRSLQQDLITLLGEALGKASCYQDLIDYEEQDSTTLSYARAADESPNMSAPPFPAIDQDASTIVLSFL
ncbi:putative C6 transcription factor [Aspergillus stella-maris]|uniref:putative C6 transcription factor n=1 Tax=Aspergillus stella-maris TaxID=1810926 RepID=UPI003CCDFCC0